MTAPILTRLDSDVGTITLNRPQARNAVTIELARSLALALERLAEGANVIVIRGAGGNFSVGGDFKQLERLRADGEAAMRELFEGFRQVCDRIASAPVPVIAAVEGYALAGGFELMQACDIAVVGADARIGDNHSNFAQVPGGGGSQRLPRILGRQRALGLILSGDHLTGEEAASWGLAYRAYEPDQFDAAVDELTRRLAAKPRGALERCKRLVHAGLELPLAAGLDLELATVLEHLASADAEQGIASFAARYGGRPR
jgi:enoyl-CoA hydratase/carnithine racemase